MARIRTIKPEFFRHEALQDLEAENPGAYVMLVFAGLWGHCDKAGRFEWKPRMLKLDILPFLSFDMGRSLSLLSDAGLIRNYCVEGKQYGEITSFWKHQRINGKESQEPEKYPPPPDEHIEKQQGSNGEATGKQQGSRTVNDASNEGFSHPVESCDYALSEFGLIQPKASNGAASSVGSNGEATGKHLRSQEGKGREVNTTAETAAPVGFAEFWMGYPKKVGKGAAEKAFRRAKIGTTLLPSILQAIERARKTEQWRKSNGQFIPNPATWLNERRWEDDDVQPTSESRHSNPIFAGML